MKGSWEEADQARGAAPVGKIRRHLHWWIALGLGGGVALGFGCQGLLSRVEAHTGPTPAGTEDNPMVLGQEPSLVSLRQELARQQQARAEEEVPAVGIPASATTLLQPGAADYRELQAQESARAAALVAASPLLALGRGEAAPLARPGLVPGNAVASSVGFPGSPPPAGPALPVAMPVPAPTPAASQRAMPVGAVAPAFLNRSAHHTVAGDPGAGAASQPLAGAGAWPASWPAAVAGLPAGLGRAALPAALGGTGPDASGTAAATSAPHPDKTPLVPTKPAATALILEGTLIPAVLLSQLNSDLPGMITAQVSEDVYDSLHGSFLAIPKGSRLIGTYGSQVVMGQERIMAAFHRLILPAGDSFELDQMQGADSGGQSGLKDEVDNRFWTRLGGQFMTAGLARIIEQPGGGVMVMGGMGGGALMGDAAGQILVDSARVGFAANAEVGPVIIIKRGFAFIVLVNRDMDFSSLLLSLPSSAGSP